MKLFNWYFVYVKNIVKAYKMKKIIVFSGLLCICTYILQGQILGPKCLGYHVVVGHNNGSVYTWGSNSHGMLGNGTTTGSNLPIKVLNGAYAGTEYLGDNPNNQIVDIAANRLHSAAVAEDGTVYAWGYNVYGELGDGTTTERHVPVKVLKGEYGGEGSTYLGDDPSNKIIAIALGQDFSMALAEDGCVYAWGCDIYDQLGRGNWWESEIPFNLPGKVLAGEYGGEESTYLGDNPDNKIISVALSGYSSFALASDGSVYAWGRNPFGGLGDNTTTQRSVPVKVLKGAYDGTTFLGDNPDNKIIFIAPSAAVAEDGTVYAWGHNDHGQLGNGTTTDSYVPIKVLRGKYEGTEYLGDNSTNKIISISSGGLMSVSLAEDGSVYTWGYNGFGGLGDGTNIDNSSPVRVNSVYSFYNDQIAIEPSEGDGSENAPYQIASMENLYWITAPDHTVGSPERAQRWASCYIQVDDIDASSTSNWNPGGSGGYEGWNPIGYDEAPFHGDYNGNGHTITGLYINRRSDYYQGMFGYIESNGKINSLGLINIDITASYYAGGLTGWNSGSISNCYSKGKVSSIGYWTGGLIGSNMGTISNSYTDVEVSGHFYDGGLTGNNSGTILNCYADGPVSGTGWLVGGLTGCNDNGEISNCYAKGSVSGEDMVGGFIGTLDGGSISNCYAVGAVSDWGVNPGFVYGGGGFVGKYEQGGLSACFWDETVNPGLNGVGSGYSGDQITGKTTTEMQTQNTYTGWDFNKVWTINDGEYPNLLPYIPDTPLPIALSVFSAVCANGSVKVTWHTVSETENAAFRIYRDEEMIAELEGAGTTSEPQDYTYTDQYVIPGRTYTYVLADISYANEEVKHNNKAVTVIIPKNDIPTEFALKDNFPNPFNPATAISYQLSADSQVELTIYDMNGRKITTLVNEHKLAGYHSVSWDASGLSSGIYFYRLIANDFVDTKKMVFMKQRRAKLTLAKSHRKVAFSCGLFVHLKVQKAAYFTTFPAKHCQ